MGAFAITLAAYAGAVQEARAQTGDSVIQGRVTTADTKAPIPEAIVTVTSPALQGGSTVLSDSSGWYRIPSLPPGPYSLRVDKDAHSSFEQPSILLRSTTTLRVDAVLVPATVAEEDLTITATAPTVDVGSSSVATTLSSDLVRRVPIARPSNKGGGVRSFESVAAAAPQAANDLYGTSVSGSTSPENRYLIDGLAVNNTAYGIGSTPLSMEFIQEVNVVTGGYLPEYGRSTGGVLNVVTKSGSNQLTANVWGNWTPGALEGNRKFLPREGSTLTYNQPTIDFITDVGGDIGGPIIKDRLWYYLGGSFAASSYDVSSALYQIRLDMNGAPAKQDIDGRSYTVRDIVPDTRDGRDATLRAGQLFGKINFAATKNHALSLNVIFAPSRAGGRGDYGVNPQDGVPDPGVSAIGNYNALAYLYKSDTLDGILKWTAASSGRRLVLETTMGWHHEKYSELPNDGSLPGATSGLASIPGVRWRRGGAAGVHGIRDFESDVPDGFCLSATVCPVNSYATDSIGILSDSLLDRVQLGSVLTWVVNALGHHVVKAGLDGEFINFDSNKAYAGYNLYREEPDGSGFRNYRNFGYLSGPDTAVMLPDLESTTQAFSFGGFVQDSWSVLDIFTVNAGVRYDAQYLYNNVDDLMLTLPNQISPRLGFIFDPSQSGRARVFGSFARYFQSVPLDMADRALSGEPTVLALRETGVCNPRDLAQARGPACLDPANLTSEATPDDPNQKFGLQSGTTPIDPDLKPSSLDEIVIGTEVEVVKSRLGVTYTRRRMNDVIEDMSRDEATTYFIGNPGRGIAKDFPKATRDYDALTLHFSRAFQNNWIAQASYTLSWLRGNYPGLFRPETGQLDPNINADFDLQSILANRTGDLPGDRRHQIKLFAARDWVFAQRHAVLTGLGFRGNSGTPTNYFGSHVLYGPDEVFILQRGSGPRLPWVYSLDVQLGYRFVFTKQMQVSAELAVYNLLNLQETASIDQRFTATDIVPIDGKKEAADIESYAITSRGVRYNPANNNPNFGNPTRTQEPRIFQFGLRASF